MHHRPRVATVVLCRPNGSLLGSLPPLEVAVPWWQEARPVVDAVREAYGLEVTVLRLLDAAPTEIGTAGGPVTYLAEVVSAANVTLARWPHEALADDPLRMPWARPGGPAADLGWADEALRRRGLVPVGAPRQIRTWNLSSLWRLPTEDGAAWLKVVPPFFAHEGGVLERLDPDLAPTVVASDGPRMLLDEVPGDDRYGASGAALLRMVALLVDLQQRWSTRVGELLALGAPDWRPPSFLPLAEDVVSRTAGELEPDEARALESLVESLPERFAAIAACGLPDTLVHGDFHPGNFRGPDERLTLLDWGDAGVGQPLLDQAAFLASIPATEHEAVRAEWTRRWQAAVPGSEPEPAAHLLEPVAALRQAIVYRAFLDRIEPGERVYHAGDPARWLRRALEVTAPDRDEGVDHRDADGLG